MLYYIIIYNKHIRHTGHSYYNIISNIKLLSILYGISNRIYELFFTNVTYTQTCKYIYIKNIEVNR